MSRFFDILSALSKSRTVVYPAVIGFVTAGVHMIGMSHDVERKVLHFVDASFGLLGAGVFVWGVMADMQNAKTKAAITGNADAIRDTNTTATVAATRADVAAVKADVAATKLTEVAAAVNANADLIDPRTETNPLVTPPQYVEPQKEKP
jgi:hypothetical protein